jgi:magnesium chelatase family protein
MTFAPAIGDIVSPGLDLAMAAAMLICCGQVLDTWLDTHLFVGEVEQDGTLISDVRGIVAIDDLACASNLAIIAPKSDFGINAPHITMERLQQLRHTFDFASIPGYGEAAKAIAIAATGRHSIHLIGQSVIDCRLVAHRIPNILPTPDAREAHELALISSAAGLTGIGRTVRSPHPSATMAALIGGGRPIGPGEVTLAHGGVLYIEEPDEFDRHAIEAIERARRDKHVHVARGKDVCDFPSDFLLVFATTPCEQGEATRPMHADMTVRITCDNEPGPSSRTLAASVLRGRRFASERSDAYVLEDEAARMLGDAQDDATLRIARTIADMDESATIGARHVRQALAYRAS